MTVASWAPGSGGKRCLSKVWELVHVASRAWHRVPPLPCVCQELPGDLWLFFLHHCTLTARPLRASWTAAEEAHRFHEMAEPCLTPSFPGWQSTQGALLAALGQRRKLHPDSVVLRYRLFASQQYNKNTYVPLKFAAGDELVMPEQVLCSYLD